MNGANGTAETHSAAHFQPTFKKSGTHDYCDHTRANCPSFFLHILSAYGADALNQCLKDQERISAAITPASTAPFFLHAD